MAPVHRCTFQVPHCLKNFSSCCSLISGSDAKVWHYRATPILIGLVTTLALGVLMTWAVVRGRAKEGLEERVQNPETESKRREVPSGGKAPWVPGTCSLEKSLEKMLKNAKKAIQEHWNKDVASYVEPTEAVPAIESLGKVSTSSAPLKLKGRGEANQGTRPKMEDRHFFKEDEAGTIIGVLDGHGGVEVADFASTVFQENFFEKLQEKQGNVHQTFEELIDGIHQKVREHTEWNVIGTTAVLCFIDLKTHRIYTATLGDSEANIYRRVNGPLKSMPLSCIRDWSSPKDAKRASIAMNASEIAESWPKERNPKKLRYNGLNISRTIGDVSYEGTVEKPAVIHKPKITVNQLKPGDVLILACDGLKDFVTEGEIIAKIKEGGDLVVQLVNYALNDKKSTDNVTVVAVQVS